jgi:hypothetical protein|tara:strand:- start:362 stop:721 length:360 start_codon:yes stop_codon:yes gene_type:complete
MSYYQQTLDLFGLNGRKPMGINLLIRQGARNIRAADANVVRTHVWKTQLDDMEALLNTTFHSYELDRQMTMGWLLDNEADLFFAQRDAEIEKGQGRVEKNHLYKEVAYKYLISKSIKGE